MPSDETANPAPDAAPTQQPADRGPPVIRTIAMPSDTNPAGDIFGGWLMAQMDLAAGNVAARRARGRCATISVEAMTFHHPVFVGDEVSLYAWILGVGRSRSASRSRSGAASARARRRCG